MYNYVKTYIKRKWSNNFLKAIMVPIDKKPNSTDCGDFRTIGLISHASKIMLSILKVEVKHQSKKIFRGRSVRFQKIKTTEQERL